MLWDRVCGLRGSGRATDLGAARGSRTKDLHEWDAVRRQIAAARTRGAGRAAEMGIAPLNRGEGFRAAGFCRSWGVRSLRGPMIPSWARAGADDYPGATMLTPLPLPRCPRLPPLPCRT